MESFSSYLGSFGELAGSIAGGGAFAGVVTVIVTYMFLSIYSKHAFKAYGLEEVKLPFGIYLKRSNVIEYANSDAVTIEGLYETIQQLEYRGREKMREVMQTMALEYAQKKPQWREYVLRGRIAIATAISDNHIVYSLTDDRIEDYILTKQNQTVDAVCEEMPKDAEEFIRKITALFFTRVIKIQKWLCLEKITAYEEALLRMKMDGSKVRCETKIQKNKKYLDAIRDIEGSSIVTSFAEESSIIDNLAPKLMADNINNVEQVAEELEKKMDSGIKIKKPDSGIRSKVKTSKAAQEEP